MSATLAILLSLSIVSTPLAQVSAGGEVDVELVLAVDVSRSMDYEEVRIQREGYVAALRHPDFIAAVQGGLNGKIAISYFEWAGIVNSASRIGWHVIETASDADAFAGLLEARPISTQRRTSISAAIAEGAAELVSNNFQGIRRVIDVSGDGPNNIGEPVSAVRSKAVEAGITINGLAIMLRPSWNSGALDQYYGDCVIGGPGSFVLPVHDVDDFATAIRRKLVLEISGKPPSAPMHNAAAEAADCMIGERQWQHFLDR